MPYHNATRSAGSNAASMSMKFGSEKLEFLYYKTVIIARSLLLRLVISASVTQRPPKSLITHNLIPLDGWPLWIFTQSVGLRGCGYLLAAGIIGLAYLHSILHNELQKEAIFAKWVHSRLRSFKVIEIDINRKPVCDVLLVFHRNYVPVFYRFRDKTWWRDSVHDFITHPCSLPIISRLYVEISNQLCPLDDVIEFLMLLGSVHQWPGTSVYSTAS